MLGLILGAAAVAALPAFASATESPAPSATATIAATHSPTVEATQDDLFPDVVSVGDVFDFSRTLDLDEPEPYFVFRSDDGRERREAGNLQPDQLYVFVIEMTAAWTGDWTAELYSGAPGEPPVVDRFTVLGSTTPEPATPSPSNAPASPTPRLTLPASSTEGSRGSGSGALGPVILVLMGTAGSIAAIARSRQRSQ